MAQRGTASLVSTVIVLTVACGGSPPPAAVSPPAPTPSQSQPLPPVSVLTNAPPPATPTADPAKQTALPSTPVLRFSEGLATPESVLYDEIGDRYLVSNVNGKPLDRDGNGYISELSPDGKVLKEKFIAGGVNNSKLDAPKGSAIAGGVFYVADISVIRKFDAKTGAPKGEIVVPGAAFLNDIAIAKDGRIFVTDSGVKAGSEGLEPMGADAVYVIDKGAVKTLAKSKDLAGPNGIVLGDNNDVLTVTMNADELYRIDQKGVRQEITKIPQGSLDGLISVGDALLVSSWKAAAIYRGKLGQKFEPVILGVSGPADIGWDSKRKRVLVPRFLDNAVEAYELK